MSPQKLDWGVSIGDIILLCNKMRKEGEHMGKNNFKNKILVNNYTKLFKKGGAPKGTSHRTGIAHQERPVQRGACYRLHLGRLGQ